MGPNPGNSVDTYSGNSGGAQGLATLVTMIAVLVIILLFCFWSAPGIRDFCRRNICCICPIQEPPTRELSSSLDTNHYQSSSRNLNHSVPLHNDNSNSMPTIVLLPFGRMLVVDRSIFAQMEADDTGLDFLELSANVIRAHHNYLMEHDQDYMRQHQQTLVRSDDTLNKDDLTLSQLSVEHRPPAYEDIFGYGKTGELPPSYSEANLLLRQLVRTGSLNILQPVFNRSNGQRSFSTRTVNDSILIHYECERSLRRFSRQQQPLRSASLDEEVVSAETQPQIDFNSSLPNQATNSNRLLETARRSTEEDHVVLMIGEDDNNNGVVK